MQFTTIIRCSQNSRRVLEVQPGSVPFFRFGKKGADPLFVRTGHTLMELVAAMVCSAVLLAGLGSVMLIGRQVAYTPTAANVRTETANAVSRLADELQYATLLIGQSTRSLEFVIADRDGDGRAKRIRYSWSGASGDPLIKTVNGGDPKTVLEAVEEFNALYVLKSQTMTLNTTSETAEAMLLSDTAANDDGDREIDSSNHFAQAINPALFSSRPANAISWNATKIEFVGDDDDNDATLLVQLRSTGGPYGNPTSEVLGQVAIPGDRIGNGPITAEFSSPVRGLALHRWVAAAWVGADGGPMKIPYGDTGASGVFESNNGGASWQLITPRQISYKVYGTYTLPGMSHNLTRNFVSHVQLALQSGGQSHARIDTSVPLVNLPEQLSAYWRADFDRDPTNDDSNGDGAPDWAMAAGAFDAGTLVGGIWDALGSLETRPPNNFTTTTIVEVRCRNIDPSGDGAQVRISADRQSGLHAPLTVVLKLQPDQLSQTLTLLGKTSQSASVTLFTRPRLSKDFVTFRLTIVPHLDLVNLHINEEDQGTYSYPVYAPSVNDRPYVTLSADTSPAEFDYADVRVTEN
jgi:hypothetical protein